MADYIAKREHCVRIPANEVAVTVEPFAVQISFDNQRQFWLCVEENGKKWGVNDVPIGFVIDALKPLIKRQIKKAKEANRG